jgi:hypothetical protein
MNPRLIPAAVLLLSSCQSMQSSDPSSLSFKMPDGSTLSLNKDLAIPDGKTHALLQAGKLTTDKDRDEYKLNCRFDVKDFGPRTIKPEVFTIRRTEDGQEKVSDAGIVRFYSDVYLDSDKGTDIIKLTCQEWGGKIDRNFTVTEMGEALGDFFTFTFPQSKPAKSGY